MPRKKKDEKLSMGTRCGWAFCLFIFAAIAIILGFNALSQVESIDLPIFIAFIPLGMGVIAILLALCVLVGWYTPSSRGSYVIIRH